MTNYSRNVLQALVNLFASSLFGGSLLYWYGIGFFLTVSGLPKSPEVI
jgi:hypothetical protein